jgi:hypothetical protein
VKYIEVEKVYGVLRDLEESLLDQSSQALDHEDVNLRFREWSALWSEFSGVQSAYQAIRRLVEREGRKVYDLAGAIDRRHVLECEICEAKRKGLD